MKVKIPKELLEPIKKYLKAEEIKLKKRKKDLAKEDPFTNQERLNDNAALDSEAAETSGHERIFALKEEIDRNLIKIRRALVKIKNGTYGICIKCQKMIDTDRLAVNPTAEHCMACHQKLKENFQGKEESRN